MIVVYIGYYCGSQKSEARNQRNGVTRYVSILLFFPNFIFPDSTDTILGSKVIPEPQKFIHERGNYS
jgi:hypothetical protein